jgi:hypothetical protein
MTNLQKGKMTSKKERMMDQAILTNMGAGTVNSFSENLRQIKDSVIMLQMKSQAWTPRRSVLL